jgi:alpha-beta hydrolase superfamily lysophospholipase
LQLAVLPSILPNLLVGNGLNADFISHDAGPAVIAAAANWAVPTLVLFAGQDNLVNPRGSRNFISKAPSSIVSSFCFETMYHEIFNEPDAKEVFAQLKPWLNTRF